MRTPEETIAHMLGGNACSGEPLRVVTVKWARSVAEAAVRARDREWDREVGSASGYEGEGLEAIAGAVRMLVGECAGLRDLLRDLRPFLAHVARDGSRERAQLLARLDAACGDGKDRT